MARTHTRTQREAKDVITEIRRRHRAGRSLASGSNRGDWLYAQAVIHFKNWGAAVEAAGFTYGDHREAALTRADLIRRIKASAKGGTVLRASEQPSLFRSSASRLFGSWTRAVKAAGLKVELPKRKWTRESVVARIHERQRAGLSTNSMAVIREEQRLYGAGRVVFGSWAAALKAAGVKPASGKRSTPNSTRRLRR